MVLGSGGGPPVREQEVREAMGELEQYLSDAIAPLLAADSLTLLVRCPPNLVAMQCESWARQQFQAHGGSVRISNLLFHAFKKIHVLSELGLIKGEVLESFLDSLKGLLVEACPQGERKVLDENLQHVGAGGQPVTRRVELLFAQDQRQRTLEAATGPAVNTVAGAESLDVGRQLRQFGALLERLTDQVGVGDSLSEAKPAASSALQRQLIAAAVESATDEQDLLRHLEQVSQKSHRKLDVAAAIRELSQDLPDWALRSGDGQSAYQGATAAAIDKIVELTEDPEAGAGRFWELVNSAAEQVNQRMLSRAVTLLDLAEKLAADPQLDPRRIKASRASAAKAIDDTALRELSMRPEVHRDLRRVLEFFPDWSPDGLLGQLDGEPDRGRRHLLLSLMELHGRAARDRCLAVLEESLGVATPDAWMWQRNLVHVLRRVPIEDHDPLEFKVLDEFSHLDSMPQLVREAITALGTTRHDDAVPILVDRLQQVLDGLAPPQWAGEVEKLKSELALALGTVDTDDARGWLVALALEPRSGLMALDLLHALTDRDLSRNPDLIRSILDTLTALLPVKVLGIALPASVATLRNRQGTIDLVKALSGTRSVEVANRLEELSKQFRGTELESVALQTVTAIRSALARGPEPPLLRTITESGVIKPPEAIAPTPSTHRRSTSPVATADSGAVFEGDLEVFRLPDLLQSLSQLGMDGRLLLDDAQGARVSEVAIREGRVHSATYGALSDDAAIYEILQAPFSGSFRFVRQVSWRGQWTGFDVMGLMMEGMRRIDEFRRVAVLIPDESEFSLTGSKPSPLTEEDATILRAIWQGAKEGKTARQIEQAVPIDRFRVRSLLAHWVEEGSLTLRSN